MSALMLRRLAAQPTTPCLRIHVPAQQSTALRSSICRPYSSEPAPPPLLVKLKGDLKTAMRAKDAARLSVLRSVLASTLNASKTESPIRTDVQLVALLRRTARSSQDAAAEFRAAGREDLAGKEEAQVAVLEGYVADSGVDAVSEEKLRGIVQAIMAEAAAEGVSAKSAMGEVMKRLLAPGGPLDGKDVEKADVARVVKEMSAAA